MSKRQLPLWLTAGKTNVVVQLKKNVDCAVRIEPLKIKPETLIHNLENNPAVVSPADKVSNVKNTPAAPPAAVAEEEPPKRRLRSNCTIPSVPKPQPDLREEYLPFVSYTGEIEYCTTFHDVAYSCDHMMQWVEKQAKSTDQPIPIAFDLEWPFSFQTGPGPTALMQLCASTEHCLLLQLSCLQKLPAALTHLLYHPRVVLHGVNIKNDFRKLARDFPVVKADRLIEKCVELGQWYNRLNGSTGIWSLARLVEQVLRHRVSKDKRVRMSKWNVLPLSDDQKMYAAIDVYIGQLLYLKLAEKERQQRDAENSDPAEDDLSGAQL